MIAVPREGKLYGLIRPESQLHGWELDTQTRLLLSEKAELISIGGARRPKKCYTAVNSQYHRRGIQERGLGSGSRPYLECEAFVLELINVNESGYLIRYCLPPQHVQRLSLEAVKRRTQAQFATSWLEICRESMRSPPGRVHDLVRQAADAIVV